MVGRRDQSVGRWHWRALRPTVDFDSRRESSSPARLKLKRFNQSRSSLEERSSVVRSTTMKKLGTFFPYPTSQTPNRTRTIFVSSLGRGRRKTMILDARINPKVATAAENFVQRYLYDMPFTHLARSILEEIPGWTEEDARQFRRLVVRELLILEQSKIRTGSGTLALDGEQSGSAEPKQDLPQDLPKTVYATHKPPFLPVMPGATVITGH